MPEYIGWIVAEAAFGLGIGLLVSLLSESLNLFGQITGLQAGYSLASTSIRRPRPTRPFSVPWRQPPEAFCSSLWAFTVRSFGSLRPAWNLTRPELS
jgi:hypothetical protein